MDEVLEEEALGVVVLRAGLIGYKKRERAWG